MQNNQHTKREYEYMLPPPLTNKLRRLIDSAAEESPSNDTCNVMDEHTKDVLTKFSYVVINALLQFGMTVDEYMAEMGEKAVHLLKTNHNVDMTLTEVEIILEVGMTDAKRHTN